MEHGATMPAPTSFMATPDPFVRVPKCTPDKDALLISFPQAMRLISAAVSIDGGQSTSPNGHIVHATTLVVVCAADA